jgi:hypothetical protein
MTRHSLAAGVWRVALMATALALGDSPALPNSDAAVAETAAPAFDEFLAQRGVDRASRRLLEAAGPWDGPRQRLAIQVLARLPAPAPLWRRWEHDALDPTTVADATEVCDRLLMIDGRAILVAAQELDPEERTLAGRRSLDIVRILLADGRVADVIVPAAPSSWPRWTAIDEAARVVGLPLATGSGPGPKRPDGGSGPVAIWPEAGPDLLVGALRVETRPETALGSLGFDYGLFDTVRDGGRLGPGDTEAFYAMLAAVARDRRAAPGPPPTDLVPLIDPGENWFARHRGDAVTIEGIARRATRITVDDAWRREQTALDAYWELVVFVPTPPLRVDGRDQESYPVICVVRELPADMPTGDRIAEWVSVSGHAFKRYGYRLADVMVEGSGGEEQVRGRRLETPLIVGRRAVWRAPPAPGPVGALSWVFLGILALLTTLLVLAGGVRSWSDRRRRHDSRPPPEPLPDDLTV